VTRFVARLIGPRPSTLKAIALASLLLTDGAEWPRMQSDFQTYRAAIQHKAQTNFSICSSEHIFKLRNRHSLD